MKTENWIILEYSKYIENVDKLSHEDDFIIYNEIKKNVLNLEVWFWLKDL